MSPTAILWSLMYVLFASSAIVHPMFGVLGYLLEYYMRPALRWWGDDLPQLRYNLIIALILGGTFLLRRSSLRQVVKTSNLALRWQLALLVVMLVVSFTVAIDRSLSIEWVTEWTKMSILFPMVAAAVIRTRRDLTWFLVAHMLGAWQWGWDAWNDPHRSQGRLMQVGSGDTFNDNEAAAHLVTVVPIALIHLAATPNVAIRGLALIALPFIVNTIILCNSRGAMLGMVGAGVAGIALIRSGYRSRTVGGLVMMGVVVLALADNQFITRQQTTTDPQDNSAQSRLITWKGALELVKDHPLGTGGRGFHLLSPIYIPGIVEAHDGDLRAPHNSYAMAACEWGILGFACYIGIYASAFLNLRRVKTGSALDTDNFFYWRAFALQLGLIAFLIAGAFTDRVYAEAGYWLVALSYALLRVQRTDQAEAQGRTSDPLAHGLSHCAIEPGISRT